MSYINPQLYAYNDYTVIVTPYYPTIPSNITQLTMQFALIGAGGSATSAGTGGGGGVFIGSVTLPTNIQNAGGYYGTPIYISAGKGGDQGASSTYISLQSYFTNHLLITPAHGEPYAINGGSAISGYGLGGTTSANQLQLVDITGNTYPITQIFAGNGTSGAVGGVGMPAGAPPWQINSDWVFITYPNTPTGQLAPNGFGGATITDPVTGNPDYGTGDKGMVIVQFNYSGFDYSLYPSLPPFNYTVTYPYYFNQGSYTMKVPYIPGITTAGNVTPVIFVLQSAGGYGLTQGLLDGNITAYAGGGGSALKASVNLPVGTVIYLYVSKQGDDNTTNTFITLINPTAPIPNPGFNGQTYCAPYVTNGSNSTAVPVIGQLNPSPGGLYYINSGSALYMQDAFNNSYPITVLNTQVGNEGNESNSLPSTFGVPGVWTDSNGYSGYLTQATITDINTIPIVAGWGGWVSENNTSGTGTDGLIIVSFGTDIPWTLSTTDSWPKQIPCFPEGTRILTPLGYKPVETIQDGYLVTTSNHKQVPVKVYKRTVHSTDRSTAPYLIPKYCLGSFPIADLRLSPHHAFRLNPDLWQIPEYAAKQNKQIRQYGIGKPVTYYHLECPNYFQDHLLVDGCVVESYGKNQVDPKVPTYVYQSGRKGFVRTAKAKAMNNSHHRFSQ